MSWIKINRNLLMIKMIEKYKSRNRFSTMIRIVIKLR